MNTEQQNEFLEVPYYSRYVDALQIYEGLSMQLKKYLNDHFEDFKVLGVLRILPPILAQNLLYGNEEARRALYDKASRAVTSEMAFELTSDIILDLCDAVHPRQRETRKVPIDYARISNLAEFELIYKRIFSYDLKTLKLAIDSGKEKGTTLVLEAVQDPSNPLCRLSREVAEQNGIQFARELGGRAVTYVPTKLEGVTLKSEYLPNARIPILSFSVSPLG